MRRLAAPLAAVVLLGAALVAAGCGGDDGAEPGAPRGASLMLDFQPGAVHAGIYAAQRRGYYADGGAAVEVRVPSDSTDAPKLLGAGRIEFAVLDIHDLGLARERGIDAVGIAALVQRPLAAVIVRDEVRRPRELEGRRVGVTGLPSDDAVLDSVVEADGGDPAKVDRVTIGFKAVPALANGRVDAVTAFWSAEGLELKRRGVEVRELRVDDYGAPAYPELVLATSRELLETEPELVAGVARATTRGYRETIAAPEDGLDDLLASVDGLDAGYQRAQLARLVPVMRPAGELRVPQLEAWARWDVEHGILEREPAVEDAFATKLSGSS